MSIGTREHTPVLVEEVLHGLNVRSSGIYVDCTFGRGGHSRAILSRLDGSGRLLVLDKDPAAIEYARELFAGESRVSIFHESFARIDEVLGQREQSGMIDGMILDLGVSSPQLEDGARGFSFQHDGTLDMRMDPTRGVPASVWLGTAAAAEITSVLRDYGEERYARRIAMAIVARRSQVPIQRTSELVEVIMDAVPRTEQHKHPATRTFQAIRIFINDELTELECALVKAINLLAVGGRLAIISFHSLEDRIVKRFFRKQATDTRYPPELPVRQNELAPALRILGKPIRPRAAEIARNPRARSAVLRIAERLAQ